MRSRGEAHAPGRAERFRLRSNQPFHTHHSRRAALPGAWRTGPGSGIVAGTGKVAAGTISSGSPHALFAALERDQPAQRVEGARGTVALQASGQKNSKKRFHRNGVETTGAGAGCRTSLVV